MALVVFLLKFGFTLVGFEDPSSGEPIIIVPLPPQTLHEAGAWLFPLLKVASDAKTQEGWVRTEPPLQLQGCICIHICEY